MTALIVTVAPPPAAAAALAALAVPLKLPWLGVAGLVVAAVGVMASLVISTEPARLDGKRERAELDRRVKVPVAPITEIDPTQIGVDPAATQTMLGRCRILPDRCELGRR